MARESRSSIERANNIFFSSLGGTLISNNDIVVFNDDMVMVNCATQLDCSILNFDSIMVNCCLVSGTSVTVNAAMITPNGTSLLVNGRLSSNGTLDTTLNVQSCLLNGKSMLVNGITKTGNGEYHGNDISVNTSNGFFCRANGNLLVACMLVTTSMSSRCFISGTLDLNGTLLMVATQSGYLCFTNCELLVNDTTVDAGYICPANGNLQAHSHCEHVDNATSYTMMGLLPQTEYSVIVKTKSRVGFEADALVNITTMQNGKS